jgi:putative hydrolase of the HAD superfamily
MEHVRGYLDSLGLLRISQETMWRRVGRENHESRNFRVRPLERRLSRIFGPAGMTEEQAGEMCRWFMKPLFALAEEYEDTVPALTELRSRGLILAIVSNTPWGCPGDLWREEAVRRGLTERVDAEVYCRDVGWRKPAKAIFRHILRKLDLEPQECIFVGDNPAWDVAGPRSIGMEAILIDRHGSVQDGEETIKDLYGLLDRLGR